MDVRRTRVNYRRDRKVPVGTLVGNEKREYGMSFGITQREVLYGSYIGKEWYKERRCDRFGDNNGRSNIVI